MTNNTTSTINNTRTSTCFTVDHFKRQIIGTEQNFKKSGILGSDQYNALMEVMAAHPNYELSAVAPKVKKQTYAGLNCELITEYVELFGNEAQKAELDKMVNDNERFPAIKSWFLDYFRAGFTVEKAKREIAHHKLNARKATVRKAVRVKVSPSVEAPAVINF